MRSRNEADDPRCFLHKRQGIRVRSVNMGWLGKRTAIGPLTHNQNTAFFVAVGNFIKVFKLMRSRMGWSNDQPRKQKHAYDI